METRIEKDLLGDIPVPIDVYWGAHTARALVNFPSSGSIVQKDLIHAMAVVKEACCLANFELGYLVPEISGAIATACREVADGVWDAQFPLDALQGGAGTSTNMNLNEVVANRALEILDRPKGDYARIHPIQHVNLHQSTNDVYPTAVKVAAIRRLRSLSAALAGLQSMFQLREKEFAGIVKIGRTEMQDAVPMTLGAEFSAFAEAFARDRWRTFKAEERLRVVNLGGTAVGTGLTAPRSYIFLVSEKLRELTGLGLARAENPVDQTANADCFVEASAILKTCATDFLKIARDLRTLHFLNEIRLEPLQAGSSIMPGKINPVAMENIIQSAMKAMAYDSLVAECAAMGTLQINEFLPLLADSLLGAARLLENCCAVMSRAVSTLQPRPDICSQHVQSSSSIVTAFLPTIGYDACETLLKEFQVDGKMNIRDFLAARLGDGLVDEALSSQRLTSLGHR